MRIIRRYLLRQLTAPFIFALAALTGFMLLNQVARRFDQLVGKGLPWTVIAEVFGLSIPFIIAMTLPMAVLVAVLYTFSHLAADNEVTAMRAGGVSVGQILLPVAVWGLLMSAVNFVFVDQVLPRSNARLRALLVDIYRKKPTFELHEQVINEIPPSQYFLRAGRIDQASGRLRDVVIYDVGDQRGRRIIYADSGVMGYASGQRDLGLVLYDGTIHELKSADPAEFRVTAFRINQIRVRDVFDQLERNNPNMLRGDREMGTCEMLVIVRTAELERRSAEADQSALLTRDLRGLLQLPAGAEPGAHPSQPAPPGFYCAWPAQLGLVGTAQDPSAAQAEVTLRPPVAATGPLASWAEAISARERANDADRRADRFKVEVHKKWSISVACVTFVLIGVVMALRFPRGGMGLVVGGGFAVFAIFYIFLTAGEALADRGLVSPEFAMWGPNLLFTVVGATGLLLVNRELGSTRGGDWQEVVQGARAWVRQRRRRQAA